MPAIRALHAFVAIAIAVSSVGCSSDVANRSEQAASSATPEPEVLGDDGPTEFVGADLVRLNPDRTISRVEGNELASPLEANVRYQELLAKGDHSHLAMQFIQEYRLPFRLKEPADELVVTRTQDDELGFHQVRLAQFFKGLPVLNTEIIVHFDADDDLYLVQAKYIETPIGIDLNPAMNLDEVISSLPGHGHLSTIGPGSGLAILPQPGDPVLVYRLQSTVSLVDQSTLFVDANSGALLGKVSTVYQ